MKIQSACGAMGALLHSIALLDDPTKNTPGYLENRSTELSKLDDETLKKLGEAGKDRRAEEDAAVVQELREKHHVV